MSRDALVVGIKQQFFECVLGALQRDDNKLCLIITMRADFFGKCLEQEYGGLAKKIQECLVTVTPMNREELETAIIKPAEYMNLAVEPELVSQMIADVEDSPGSLPLLQYTLTELWQQRTEERLTLTTYSKLGGVRGTLQTRATEVYESLSLEEQQATKRIFLELTQLGEGTEDTRRQLLQRDLVTSQHPEAVINRIIQRLADEKLVVTSTLSNQIAVVDVAHEALIRHWLLLRKWIEESRDILRQKRKIEAAAIEWRDRGKAKDYLLQGKRLTEAKVFHKEQAENLRLSQQVEEFIQASGRQKRNNCFESVVFSLIIPLGLVIYLAPVVRKQTEIRLLWQTVDAAKRDKSSQRLNQALEQLVKAGESLERRDFSTVDLSRIELSSANIKRAYLSSTNFSNANLSNANLYGADLMGANLYHADFSGANLTATNLYDADLSYVNIRGADLRRAKLNHANFTAADISSANFTAADFSRADFTFADFSRAILIGANLSGADLSYAKNLTPEQVKSAKNWDKAKYDEVFRAKLGLPPEPAK